MKGFKMKIAVIINNLEKRLESPDGQLLPYQKCAVKLLTKLKSLSPNTIVQWGGDCTHTGDHYPVDEDGNIHFDKKRFFREGEQFPDDEFIWIPTP